MPRDLSKLLHVSNVPLDANSGSANSPIEKNNLLATVQNAPSPEDAVGERNAVRLPASSLSIALLLGCAAEARAFPGGEVKYQTRGGGSTPVVIQLTEALVPIITSLAEVFAQVFTALTPLIPVVVMIAAA